MSVLLLSLVGAGFGMERSVLTTVGSIPVLILNPGTPEQRIEPEG